MTVAERTKFGDTNKGTQSARKFRKQEAISFAWFRWGKGGEISPF